MMRIFFVLFLLKVQILLFHYPLKFAYLCSSYWGPHIFYVQVIFKNAFNYYSHINQWWTTYRAVVRLQWVWKILISYLHWHLNGAVQFSIKVLAVEWFTSTNKALCSMPSKDKVEAQDRHYHHINVYYILICN